MSFRDTRVAFNHQFEQANEGRVLSWAKLNAMLALAQGLMAIAQAIREVARAIRQR